jgi:anthranilate phosphoribosyltransferase
MVQAMRLLVTGTPSEIDRLTFLRTLHPNKANGEMLGTAAAVLRMLAVRVPCPHSGGTHSIASSPFSGQELFDCCGTGGDRLGLFNISTLAGVVIAAAGIKVAKHGNRAITSQCGSADLLEKLGVSIEQSPEKAAHSLEHLGITFLFAPRYHQATRNVQPLRLKLRQEGHATFFNLLGPLSNPLKPTCQLVGVYHPTFLLPVAQALHWLGCRSAWVVCGDAGDGNWIDEVSPLGATQVVELKAGLLTQKTFQIAEVGFAPLVIDALKGQDAAYNATLAREILAGRSSPCSEAVCLNAGIGLYLNGKVDTVKEGIEQARELLRSGAAGTLLEKWIQE